MRQWNPIATRARLLGAAAERIAAAGLERLTLDEVAAAAGVSKGGLLHHFPTKLALLEGLVGHLAEEFFARLTRVLADEPADGRGRWARAYIRATFDTPTVEVALMSALAAATPTYPGLVAIFFAAFATLDADHDDGLPVARRTLIRLACDGLALAEVSGWPSIDATIRAALFDELMGLSR